MIIRNFIAATALSLAGIAGTAFATTYTFDASSSSITFDERRNACDCTVSAEFVGDIPIVGRTSADTIPTVLIDWTATAAADATPEVAVFRVAIDLTYESDTGESVTGGTRGRVRIVARENSHVHATVTFVDDPVLSFANGDTLTVNLEETFFWAFYNTTSGTSGSTITVTEGQQPSPVPVPAAGLLLLTALGGLGFVGRR
ncbi:VPLPA-CTERM sorting domain-containing protein, partial [Paramylibacter kogurei]|uniref:VPLPA-CTERM sorting domain-containing protein n=1 Tax=Paramylibacter kogurei TaxID=1889778 RepID=UPI000DF36D26